MEIHRDHVTIVYKVPQNPFVPGPANRGKLQHWLSLRGWPSANEGRRWHSRPGVGIEMGARSGARSGCAVLGRLSAGCPRQAPMKLACGQRGSALGTTAISDGDIQDALVAGGVASRPNVRISPTFTRRALALWEFALSPEGSFCISTRRCHQQSWQLAICLWPPRP